MAKKPEAAPEAGQVKARVLVSSAWGEPNDIVNVSEADAALGLAAGALDASPESVAYAESLAAE